MAHGPTKLIDIGERFLLSMNARDYESAAAMYATDACYESPARADGAHGGRIVGRDQIIRYFTESLEGDDEFQLVPLDQFTGFNMIVLLSSTTGRTFIDVLRIDDAGLIVEHLEVSPKQSPLNFPSEMTTS